MSASGTPAAALMRTHSGRQPSLAPPASPQAFISTAQFGLSIELPLWPAYEYGAQVILSEGSRCSIDHMAALLCVPATIKVLWWHCALTLPTACTPKPQRECTMRWGLWNEVHTCWPPVLLLRQLESIFRCSPSAQPLLIAQWLCCSPLLPCAAPHSP